MVQKEFEFEFGIKETTMPGLEYSERSKMKETYLIGITIRLYMVGDVMSVACIH